MYACIRPVKQEYIRKFAQVLISLYVNSVGSLNLKLHSKKGKSHDTAFSPQSHNPKVNMVKGW
jgi:hypothetical protein